MFLKRNFEHVGLILDVVTKSHLINFIYISKTHSHAAVNVSNEKVSGYICIKNPFTKIKQTLWLTQKGPQKCYKNLTF